MISVKIQSNIFYFNSKFLVFKSTLMNKIQNLWIYIFITHYVGN